MNKERLLYLLIIAVCILYIIKLHFEIDRRYEASSQAQTNAPSLLIVAKSVLKIFGDSTSHFLFNLPMMILNNEQVKILNLYRRNPKSLRVGKNIFNNRFILWQNLKTTS
jgi:hypothetical protein